MAKKNQLSFYSYSLTNGKQHTKVSSPQNFCYHIISGVTQGSAIGSLLLNVLNERIVYSILLGESRFVTFRTITLFPVFYNFHYSQFSKHLI